MDASRKLEDLSFAFSRFFLLRAWLLVTLISTFCEMLSCKDAGEYQILQ